MESGFNSKLELAWFRCSGQYALTPVAELLIPLFRHCLPAAVVPTHCADHRFTRFGLTFEFVDEFVRAGGDVTLRIFLPALVSHQRAILNIDCTSHSQYSFKVLKPLRLLLANACCSILSTVIWPFEPS